MCILPSVFGDFCCSRGKRIRQWTSAFVIFFVVHWWWKWSEMWNIMMKLMDKSISKIWPQNISNNSLQSFFLMALSSTEIIHFKNSLWSIKKTQQSQKWTWNQKGTEQFSSSSQTRLILRITLHHWTGKKSSGLNALEKEGLITLQSLWASEDIMSCCH